MQKAYISAGEAIIRLPDVLRRTGLSRSSIYAFMRNRSEQNAPAFPHPIPLGLRSRGWLAREVDAWIAARVQLRDSQVGVTR